MGDSCLQGLLSPVSRETFFFQYFGKDLLHIRRYDAAFYAAVLSLEDLDALLQNELIPATAFNVVVGGKVLAVEDWTTSRTLPRGPAIVGDATKLLAHYQQGATLVVNGANMMIPPVAAVCRQLTAEMGVPVQANVYITPPRSQGFVRHKDDHDVIVLQIAGSKAWLLHTPTLTRESELRAGDLLYIPRGMPHEARANDDASIHITIGVHSIYPFRLIEELVGMVRAHPDFQRPLMPDSAAAANEDDSRLLENLQKFLVETGLPALLQRRRQRLADTQPQGWEGRFSDTISERFLTNESVLRRRQEVIHTLTATAVEIRLSFAGNTMKYPFFLEPCLRQILGFEPFRVGALEGPIPDSGKAEFLKPLILAGLLKIVSL